MNTYGGSTGIRFWLNILNSQTGYVSLKKVITNNVESFSRAFVKEEKGCIMGSLGKDISYADLGSANCSIGLNGCQPDQPLYIPSTMLRYQQRRVGESCYGMSGAAAPGLYCNKDFKVARLPWDPHPTNPEPLNLYRVVRKHHQ